MPLLAEAGGHTYRLDGELYFSGPSYGWIGLSGEEEQVSVSLPTGAPSVVAISTWTSR